VSAARGLPEPPAWAVRVAVHVGSLVPLVRLLWDGYTRHLTVNPIQALTQRTGYPALVLVLVTLACTPLNTVLGLRWTVPPRRTLGLYAFFYACLHVLLFTTDYFFLVDEGQRWAVLSQQLVEKNYIVAGLAAFVLLVPLAVTSTKGWQRRLGRRWRWLHRAQYVAAPLAVTHFLWNAKGGADRNEPLVFGAVATALLLLRLPAVRRAAYRRRARPGAGARTLVLE
jgi:sulfoxide reductase heme-binding subunit YedZ